MSTRRDRLVELVPASATVVDIGCDHGYMSLALAQRSDIQQILATDISYASLAKLKDALKKQEESVRRKIQTKVADGLKKLPWETAETILIAGMGGPLILRILQENPTFSDRARCWVLSPQSGIPAFREAIWKMNVRVEEDLLQEDGKFYPLFRVWPQESVRHPATDFTPFSMTYGPTLLRQHHPVLLLQLHANCKEQRGILKKLEASKGVAPARVQELARRLEELEQAMEEWPEEGIC